VIILLNIYNTNLENGNFEEVTEITKGCWINLKKPTEEEIQAVCQKVNIERDFIGYALDYEEKPRIDQEEKDGTTLFIIDIPNVKKTEQGFLYYTIPLGMIVVRDDFFITVCLEDSKIIDGFKSGKYKSFSTFKKSRFILQILYKNAEYYLSYLKRINKEKELAENVLKKSMKNKELLKLQDIQKSLVYFETSIKANELVMEKTLKGKYIKLYEEDEDILEDAIIENRQAMEMSQIYTNILKGTIEVYGSIISNNLSGVMKFLTSITIFLAVPTMISGFWGMNVPVPFAENPWGFVAIIGFSAVLTIIIAIWLKKKDMLN
jgi:magnesium transporter